MRSACMCVLCVCAGGGGGGGGGDSELYYARIKLLSSCLFL